MYIKTLHHCKWAGPWLVRIQQDMSVFGGTEERKQSVVAVAGTAAKSITL